MNVQRGCVPYHTRQEMWARLLSRCVALLALAGDLRMLLGSGVLGTQRIARHLWRMCFAWFIASASIFLARPHLFPAIMRKSGALIFLTVLPLMLLLFWMVRVKYSRGFRKLSRHLRQRSCRWRRGKQACPGW